MPFIEPGIEIQRHGRREAHRTIGSERVVFALERECQDQFLAQFRADPLSGVDCRWVELDAHDAPSWERLLFDLEPTVLVTGWGSPAIPARFACAPGSPLRYVCHLTGSVRQIVPRGLIECGVTVSNWGKAVSGAVAEHALLLTLATLRELPAWSDYMARWPGRGAAFSRFPVETRTLHGKRVGLHGFGSVARALVRMLAPFGVSVAAYSAGVPEELFARHGVQRRGSLSELFADSDVLIECEALTAHSRGTVSAPVLQCLPAGAVFVNVGRGQVVDEAALARVAAEKGLRLGLDVYQEEPLPAASPLRALPRALLSPHIAGPTQDGFAGLCAFALANLRRHLRREPVEAVVSLEVYDRST